MNRVVHFEIQADDPQRAIEFYTRLFGWKFEKWDGPIDYWLIETGPKTEPGIDGGLGRRQAPIEGPGINAFTCTVGVADLDAAVARATAAGGVVALPRMPVRGVGWLAYLKDPDGNTFGVLQGDMSAK